MNAQLPIINTFFSYLSVHLFYLGPYKSVCVWIVKGRIWALVDTIAHKTCFFSPISLFCPYEKNILMEIKQVYMKGFLPKYEAQL